MLKIEFADGTVFDADEFSNFAWCPEPAPEAAPKAPPVAPKDPCVGGPNCPACAPSPWAPAVSPKLTRRARRVMARERQKAEKVWEPNALRNLLARRGEPKSEAFSRAAAPRGWAFDVTWKKVA
jgi:hypothetical protein